MILNRKGITPIISVILLLMMVIAIAGIAYMWLQGMQETIQTTSGNASERLLGGMGVKLVIEGYTLNCSTGTGSTVDVYVRNGGSEKANNLRVYVGEELQTSPVVPSLDSGTTTNMTLSSVNCSNWNQTSKTIKITSDEMTEEETYTFTCTNVLGVCD